MHPLIPVLGLFLIAFAVNIPLGHLRQRHAKFSFAWYFYIHISIPLIIFLRVKAGFSWHIIPLTIGGAILGQLLGGRLYNRQKGNG